MIKSESVSLESIKRINQLPEILKNYPKINVLYLFGSLAEGLNNNLSDIDLAYLSFSEIHDIEELHYQICSFLKTNEVDLVNMKNIPVSSQYNIIANGKLIFCNDELFLSDYKENVFNNYFDFLPYLKEYHKCFAENMKT